MGGAAADGIPATRPDTVSSMSRRIDIELTSSLPDGSWTWRAAGARVPKGVVDGTLLPAGSKVGDELKVEVDQELDGLVVVGVVQGRAKVDRRELLELIASSEDFEPVIQQSNRERGERRGRPSARRGPSDDRPPRRRDEAGRGGERRDRQSTGRDRETPGRDRDERRRRQRSADGPAREPRGSRPARPSFVPPPDLPSRPKPKRLKAGHTHRNEVLAGLPPEQRPVAELALQGMVAVRQRLEAENRRLVEEGKPVMPEASVMKMAEELVPRLRLADWMDRAEAAQRHVDDLDLRDLRSVVAGASDPIVARDDRARAMAAELQAALVSRQEVELDRWYGDIDAALAVGRVIRALRLSSQPPKAGVRFPADLAQRLALSANAALAPSDGAERWVGILEAAAFSPIRGLVEVKVVPDPVSDELRATVTRLGPALPQVAAVFGIEVVEGRAAPKPLRPVTKAKPTRRGSDQSGRPRGGRGAIPPPPTTPADSPAAEPVADAEPVVVAEVVVDAEPVTTAESVAEDIQ